MELKVGDSLSTILRKLAENQVEYRLLYTRETLLGMFVRLCDAVAYAHSEKVLHLDLKPSNVQIGRFGGVQLCDWGLARVIGSPEDEAVDVMVKGTPGYMAPEQVQAGAKSLQTDIYALGGILYAILTYHAPFSGTSDEIMRKTREGKLVRPAKAYPGRHVPESLDAVVMKAMALDPAARYETVEELQREVQRYLAGYATSAENAGIRRLLHLVYMRNRTLCWSIGSAVAVIVAGTGLFIHELRLSEGRAVEQKHLAEDARRQAEDNFRLYKEETRESLKLSENIRSTTMDMLEIENFLDAPAKVLVVGSHLERETDPARRAKLLEYLGMLHFVQQNFNQAVESFGQVEVSRRYSECHALAAEYAGRKTKDNRWLSAPEVLDVLVRIPGKLENARYLFAYYYCFHRRFPDASQEKLLPIVEMLLDSLNKRSLREIRNSTLTLEKREKGWHLSLEGSPYAVFSMPLSVPSYRSNVLVPLNLHSLDLSHSAFSDLEQLQGINVSELNIAGVSKIAPHKFHMLNSLKVKTLYHTLELSDASLQKLAPQVRFVRVVE
jgi:serine/threonine-protein kinase